MDSRSSNEQVWTGVDEIAASLRSVSDAFKQLGDQFSAEGFAEGYAVGLEYMAVMETATPKELHYIRHARKERTRKKYINRVFARAAKGGGASVY